MKKVIITERLILREFRNDDYFDFIEYISDSRVNKKLGIATPENEKTQKALFNANMKNPFCWAAQLKGTERVIGDFHFDNIIENYLGHYGFALNYEYQNQGYALEASKKIIEYGLDILKLKRIRAVSLINNSRSIKLLEKLEFKKEALIYEYDFGGKIGDVFYFSIVKDNF